MIFLHLYLFLQIKLFYRYLIIRKEENVDKSDQPIL